MFSKDHGLHAYLYLFASFMIELLAWSLPFSYGVFLNYYNEQHAIESSPTHSSANPVDHSSTMALVGTLATGIMYLAYPLVLRTTSLYPWYCQPIMAVGLVLCVAGLVGAAFATKPWHFVLSQGLSRLTHHML